MKKYLVFKKEKYGNNYLPPEEADSLEEIIQNDEYEKDWIITKPVKIKIVEDETPCQTE